MLVHRTCGVIPQHDQQDGRFAQSTHGLEFLGHYAPGVPWRTHPLISRVAFSGSFFTFSTRCLFKTTARMTSELVSDSSLCNSPSSSAIVVAFLTGSFPPSPVRPACRLLPGSARRVARTWFLTGRRTSA